MPTFLSGVKWNLQRAVVEAQQLSFEVSDTDICAIVQKSDLEPNTSILLPTKDSHGNPLLFSSVLIYETYAQLVVDKQTTDEYIPNMMFGQGTEKSATALLVMLSSDQPLDIIVGSQVTWRTSDLFFNRSDIFQFITPQQLKQFEAMNPNVIKQAYTTAIGSINAQIGNYYDLEAMLAETDTIQKDETLMWVLKVFTAFNILAPSMQISAPMQYNFDEANKTLSQLKGGQQSFVDAPMKEDNAARGKIVSSIYKYLG